MIHDKELYRIIQAINIPVGSETSDGRFRDIQRLKAIEEEINENNSPYYLIDGREENYYHLYGKKNLSDLYRINNRILLISSHADNLQDEAVYHDHGKYIEGTFDNVVTNAVCVYLMNNLELPENVLFAFTANEEDDSMGAKKLAKRMKDIFGEGNVDVIVLDVTCGGYKEIDYKIENDFIYKKYNGRSLFKKVCDSISGLGYKWDYMEAPPVGKEENPQEYFDIKDIVKNSGCRMMAQYSNEDMWEDEATEYDEADFNVFSLCLTTSAKDDVEMHDNKGFYILKESLCNYTYTLYRMIIKSQPVNNA